MEPVDRLSSWSPILSNEAHRFPDSVLPHALAAIRETFEEVGLLLIRGQSADAETKDGAREDQRKWKRDEVVSWRKRTHDEAGEFLNLCNETTSVPMTGALAYWSNVGLNLNGAASSRHSGLT